MGAVRGPGMARMVCGIIYGDVSERGRAMEALESEFGAADDASPDYEFNFTDYYGTEMGARLCRRFVRFAAPFDPGRLADAKVLTNRMEHDLLSGPDGNRRVNLDPGYITAAKLVLATTKDFSHRIYIRDGIFAEVTLQFGRGGVKTMPWTYPDLASGACDEFFLRARRSVM
ncbi:MAG: DUF4416 family protein [Lentisphaerae bacterium]|nr:DUF4416 family protein [Lentisphaerota bacterium]